MLTVLLSCESSLTIVLFSLHNPVLVAFVTPFTESTLCDALPMARAARHMTLEELNRLRLWQGGQGNLGARELWKMHAKDRKGRRKKPLCLRAFRNVLNGPTYNS